MRHQNSVSGEATKESQALMTNSTQNFHGCSLIRSSQVRLDEDLNKLPKLGLKLSITPSLVDEVKQVMLKSGYSIDGEERANKSGDANPVTETKPRDNIVQRARKTKAETFKISMLQIGSWQRVSREDGDLVAKCYYSKRKLVWEFLEIDGFKRKIEIQWHDILSLRPFVFQGQLPGVLEIELTHPPVMYHETEPKPRKHTQWEVVSDFTEGLATTYRRHYLEFPPGVLDAPIQKILRTDNRLFQMTQQNFPILKSPYFSKYAFRDSALVNINPQPQPQQRSFGNAPPFFPAYQPAPLKSPAPAVDSSENGRNQMPPLEGQGGIINVGDNNLTADQNRGTMMPPAATSLPQVNSTEPFENSYFPLPPNEFEGLVPMEQLPMMFPPLDDHQQNMVFNNPLHEFPNNITDDDLFLQEHFQNNMINDGVSPTLMVDNNAMINNGFSNNGVGGGGGQMYPQAMNWPSGDHQFSSSVNLNDFNHEINNWAHDFNPNPWQ